MRLSDEQIKELQKILHEQCNLELSEEETQQAGLAIMRFVIVKEARKHELENDSPKVQQQ